MVKDRRIWPGLGALIGLAGLMAGGARADEGPVRLSEAGQSGVFTVGQGRASVAKEADGSIRVDYDLPVGTAAGAWAKGFPAGLARGGVDSVEVSVKGSGAADQGRRVSAKLEIKGQSGVQRVDLVVGPDWSRSERPIEWDRLVGIDEVVVAIGQVGKAPASGSLSIDVRFVKTSWLRSFAGSPPAKFAAVLAIALALAVVEWVGRRFWGEGAAPGFQAAGLRLDVVRGVGVALILGLSLAIFERGDPGGGWDALWFAPAGAAVAGWWKFGLTGRHLTPGEAFCDATAVGLLGVSSSPLLILQAPSGWSEALLLSQAAASVAALAYLGFVAARIGSTGRHPGAVAGALIIGTPYLMGSLVLLSSTGLTGGLGASLTGSIDPEATRSIGRALVLFGFNLALAQALSLATRRRLMASIPAILALLLVAVAATAGPLIADLGSGARAAALGPWGRMLVAVVSGAFSQAGLWGEVYLVTGLLMDALRGEPPTRQSTTAQPWEGMKKGMIYSGTFLAILYGLGALGGVGAIRRAFEAAPVLPWVALGTVAFPLVKTIFETFDGSQGFFRRAWLSYRTPRLYARGAVVGLALGVALAVGVDGRSMASRAAAGLGFGAVAYAGVNLLGDLLLASRGRGRVQNGRVYLVQGLLGGFIGAALGFYFDSVQVAVVASKFREYLGVGLDPQAYGVRPFLSRWGFIDLGTQSGGVKLLYDEALSGVIEWSIPAWLFAINRTFLAAYFQRETAPIKGLFTRDGLAGLTQTMIVVLRWGLWMSPIIKSFLRPMGEPTWYNQDGAIRTLFATYHDATMTPEDFRAWSLQVFVSLLAFDAIRILIWLDHMGLRVATLVNLSFLGMDRLDNKVARFVRPASTARFIPEGVKRFTTWAPLLIPFYIPRGDNWKRAWDEHLAIQANHGGGTLLAPIEALPVGGQAALIVAVGVACAGVSMLVRMARRRSGAGAPASWTVANPAYRVTLKSTGEVISECRGFDVTRRSYDGLDPSGRALFVTEGGGEPWAVVGNAPGQDGAFGRSGDALRVVASRDGLRVTIEIRPAGPSDPAEVWDVTVDNATDRPRSLRVAPYLEWVLNQAEADRSHTQYNRLFAEMEYAKGLHAVLAWDNHAKAMGLLASDLEPKGFLTARVDFIGRAGTVWKPRALETLAFSAHQDADAHPTFDPIGALLLSLEVPRAGSKSFRLLIGMAGDKAEAVALIARHLHIPGAERHTAERRRKLTHSIRHGEIPPGTPDPYTEFSDDGRTLRVLTPFTPRPFDHTLANALGHVVSVTNRGMQTTSSVNAQQNRITPDWPDAVTREVPPEAFYLFDLDSKEWFSPTYQPLNDAEAACEAEFGVDGTAVFRMSKGEISTELTVFVPPSEPCGIYLLTVRNRGERPRKLRFAPYFQIVLATQPEFAGPLDIKKVVTQWLFDPEFPVEARTDQATCPNALLFENPRNTYRTGPAFAMISVGRVEAFVTSRGQFFGPERDVARPMFVESGQPADESGDDRPVAAFLTTLEVPPGGESSVVVVLGQADDAAQVERMLLKYRSMGPLVEALSGEFRARYPKQFGVDAANASLATTRAWWLALMETVRVKTDRPEFDRYLDWLKYQALVERIWARRGFYQSGGAFGFRDQLQDAVNLLWMDPALARAQILLHGSQQFPEGDVAHWFHRLQDGRTGFVGRTHASDNLLWLAWAVVEYLGATGDDSLLDERTAYLESELPFPPLPEGKQGIGFDPLRSSREDTIYRHALKAVDLVLDKRMGAHGLPLMGTGDWNDGLDEIGSQGRGESVWLGFFLYYILERLAPVIGRVEGEERQDAYLGQLRELGEALESTWRDDRYLRAFHDDGTEIGVKGSGVWEVDALNAAWAVMAGINPGRGRAGFETAVSILEKEKTILLGWPPLREDTKPYLGRSSAYPEGVRENGMYCHGVQWLVGAARLLSERASLEGRADDAAHYRDTALRLWRKISPLSHTEGDEIETYGGQPNQQSADMVTTFDPGRMIWNGYTGSAGWMFRQAIEGVLGYRLVEGRVVPPPHPDATPPDLGDATLARDLQGSPLARPNAIHLPRKPAVDATPTLPS